MDTDLQVQRLRDLARTAERLTSLADTAELMGDGDSAARWRVLASNLRLQAMAMLDD